MQKAVASVSDGRLKFQSIAACKVSGRSGVSGPALPMRKSRNQSGVASTVAGVVCSKFAAARSRARGVRPDTLERNPNGFPACEKQLALAFFSAELRTKYVRRADN